MSHLKKILKQRVTLNSTCYKEDLYLPYLDWVFFHYIWKKDVLEILKSSFVLKMVDKPLVTW